MVVKPEQIVEDMLTEIAGYLLVRDDDLSSAFMETNASPFEFDEGEIERSRWAGRGRITFLVGLTFVGETPEEQGENGEKVEAAATGSLVDVGGKWTVESATTTSTRVVRKG
ncbi:hypothetical protein [Hyalangium versicolor]|uniref:hypothetical protein n=1 Tax=Hyalangium versicolor TaxID=2861190 RepID=UPI001CCD1022|nr:hypothetical protein [Hyalangium versicolor]